MKKTNKFKEILHLIDWDLILEYHNKLKIYWDIQNEDGVSRSRIPGLSDLKSEVLSLLNYMFNNDIDNISYGNWIIFRDSDDLDNIGKVRIIFRIIDLTFVDEKDELVFNTSFELEYLKEELNNAITEENYEFASVLRDRIHKYKKTDLKNE